VNAALHGPIATADALQTLKPRRNAIERIILREEIGDRAFRCVTEITRCTHRCKARAYGSGLWECVADSHNARTPGCGALFAVTYSQQHGTPTWTPAEVTR
jgi:hypothetical protein